MKIRQIRNATLLLDYGFTKILIDPMLAKKGRIPSLKWLTKSRQRNPLVELPEGTSEVLNSVTHVLITHCQKGHFDHLDRAGTHWLRQNQIPVLCPESDRNYLAKQGLKVQGLNTEKENLFLNGSITLIPCLHGKGIVGSFMAHGYGYILKFPDQPTVYVVGDSILSTEVQAAVRNHEPDVVIMPGGGARFDIGSEVIMGAADVPSMAHLFKGKLIVNHLEALDHCPTTRKEVREIARGLDMQNRILVPEDGENIEV
ncbi:MBL fold metallo-hydrolase [Bdellovibrio sp. 22V]|uniref:MBL fold metallo-hydrolase n=1 Tax=Bdellovibrio sp. 22V TaxID=3044166 RepID=UPI002542BDD3|nr:MBL fold metallo-hydrolase [Bdellovibrio sp. 22V]WII71360.1 MBL fold metallo-hydrolase [Bdellovibrio sp. 22V]